MYLLKKESPVKMPYQLKSDEALQKDRIVFRVK